MRAKAQTLYRAGGPVGQSLCRGAKLQYWNPKSSDNNTLEFIAFSELIYLDWSFPHNTFLTSIYSEATPKQKKPYATSSAPGSDTCFLTFTFTLFIQKINQLFSLEPSPSHCIFENNLQPCTTGSDRGTAEVPSRLLLGLNRSTWTTPATRLRWVVGEDKEPYRTTSQPLPPTGRWPTSLGVKGEERLSTEETRVEKKLISIFSRCFGPGSALYGLKMAHMGWSKRSISG
jgi:hypothetical protein